MLSVEGQWVWDFWIADDGIDYHCFYLFAPSSLLDEHARHRHARIGHAVSKDLTDWTVLGTVFEPGPEGSFDETTTWTGSVVQGDDRMWRMFYTGSRFLGPEPDRRNIETIGVATSSNLYEWSKHPGPIVTADPRWYEVWGTSTWREEAWRDPWVFRSPDGDGWHMLITARANEGAEDNRGVIGHAWSPDLTTWQVRPPLSATESGYAHLEVPQVSQINGRWVLLFSCNTARLSGRRQADGETGGVWYVPIDLPTQPYYLNEARLLLDESRYSGRLVRERSGRWVLLAFINDLGDGFVGKISDPIALTFEEPEAISAHGLTP